MQIKKLCKRANPYLIQDLEKNNNEQEKKL